MSRRLQLAPLLVFLSFLPGLTTAAGKCERLVATGNPEYPPYLWRDPQDPQHLIGTNADLLKQIGKELGLKVDVIYTGSWSKAQDEVRTGRVDLIAGAVLTIPRLETMDYVHPAFLQTQSVVWVKRDRAFPLGTWDDLRGRNGSKLIKSSFGESFDRFAQENLTLEPIPNLTQAYQKLLLHRTDYVLYERARGLALADTLGMADDLVALEPPISSEGLYFTLSHNSACNDPWLRGQLAKKMTELVAAGVPKTLLERNLERWKASQMQPVSTPE
ncbi:substrate-binding periplasmic protein [Metapseudomonas boanensis]|uniref:Transporter substrate-binding domain-containing protein n=1 Tax=Metapseudomonas boanensis TaxID=2822138 RepID=A0ABS5XKW1_9GAMM|nr:transporter substrate-binding domain-containing protein [Pseudomonas boanensis]MBT8768349.1 transporter substrate-binding domain-containing protein [Pseudomonas boanensis]